MIKVEFRIEFFGHESSHELSLYVGAIGRRNVALVDMPTSADTVWGLGPLVGLGGFATPVRIDHFPNPGWDGTENEAAAAIVFQTKWPINDARALRDLLAYEERGWTIDLVNSELAHRFFEVTRSAGRGFEQ